MDFEAKLAALKADMERGLGRRIEKLDAAMEAWHAGDESGREDAMRVGHQIRGIAGSHGHHKLGELGGEVEEVGRAGGDIVPIAKALRAEAMRIFQARNAADAATNATEQDTEESGARSIRRALVIDDDPATARLLTLALERFGGYEVVNAASGSEALVHLDKDLTVIVSDAMMPDMNGLELCREEHARGHRRPMIILSAAAPEELGWDISDRGPDAWMRKPVHPRELVAAIDKLLLEAKKKAS